MSDIINWNNANSDIELREDGVNGVVAKASTGFWNNIMGKIEDFVSKAFENRKFITEELLNSRTVVETVDMITTTTRPLLSSMPAFPVVTVVDVATGEVVSVSVTYYSTQVKIALSQPQEGVIRSLKIIYKY